MNFPDVDNAPTKDAATLGSKSLGVTSLVNLVLLVGILLAIHQYLGPRVVVFTGSFALLWFTITLVLLSRPPAVPELREDIKPWDEKSWESFREPAISRREIFKVIPFRQRLNIALTVAIATCLLLWLTIGGLGR